MYISEQYIEDQILEEGIRSTIRSAFKILLKKAYSRDLSAIKRSEHISKGITKLRKLDANLKKVIKQCKSKSTVWCTRTKTKLKKLVTDKEKWLERLTSY